jgi:ribonuclease HII
VLAVLLFVFVLYTIEHMHSYRIGIDEVGRGPIAGPLVVCACAVRDDVDILDLFPKRILKDSKKLTEKNREAIITSLADFTKEKKILFGIGEISSERLDEIGLTPAINKAIKHALTVLHSKDVSPHSFVFLDGALHAPETYSQETIIKGDEKIGEIALASIIAKSYRDMFMKTMHEVYPLYGFDSHVGYGTKAHYEAIHKHGLTPLHRRSFLKKM